MEQDLIEFTRSICLPSGIDLTRYLINYINQNAKLYDLMIRNKTKFTVSVESYDSYGIVYVLTNLEENIICDICNYFIDIKNCKYHYDSYSSRIECFRFDNNSIKIKMTYDVIAQ